jgi:hypothetical protein
VTLSFSQAFRDPRMAIPQVIGLILTSATQTAAPMLTEASASNPGQN